MDDNTWPASKGGLTTKLSNFANRVGKGWTKDGYSASRNCAPFLSSRQKVGPRFLCAGVSEPGQWPFFRRIEKSASGKRAGHMSRTEAPVPLVAAWVQIPSPALGLNA